MAKYKRRVNVGKPSPPGDWHREMKTNTEAVAVADSILELIDKVDGQTWDRNSKYLTDLQDKVRSIRQSISMQDSVTENQEKALTGWHQRVIEITLKGQPKKDPMLEAVDLILVEHNYRRNGRFMPVMPEADGAGKLVALGYVSNVAGARCNGDSDVLIVLTTKPYRYVQIVSLASVDRIHL